MSIMDALLPLHSALTQKPGSNRKLRAKEEAAGRARLQRFEPWITGLLNMIEEGDYQHALTFHQQIGQRLAVMERESRADETGVVKKMGHGY